MHERVFDHTARAGDAQVDGAAIGRLIIADERVGRSTSGFWHSIARANAGFQHLRDQCAGGPPGRTQQRHVDHLGFARLLAVIQRRRDATGNEHAADGIAKGGNSLAKWRAQLGGRKRVGDAADFAFGTLISPGTSTSIDDVWIGSADVFDVKLVLLTNLRQVVREEDIASLRQGIEQLLAFWCRDVNTDTAFAPIGVFDERVAQGIQLDTTHVEKTSLRVTANGVFYLDDVRAPVGENGPGGGDEGKLRHFQHPDALHNLAHGSCPTSCSILRKLLRWPVVSSFESHRAPLAVWRQGSMLWQWHRAGG